MSARLEPVLSQNKKNIIPLKVLLPQAFGPLKQNNTWFSNWWNLKLQTNKNLTTLTMRVHLIILLGFLDMASTWKHLSYHRLSRNNFWVLSFKVPVEHLHSPLSLIILKLNWKYGEGLFFPPMSNPYGAKQYPTTLTTFHRILKIISARQGTLCESTILSIFLLGFFFNFENIGLPPPPQQSYETLTVELGPLDCLTTALGPLACLTETLGPLAYNLS